MGKQEFASGGFTGKVGKFVGQRNGSGLILREWVKTPNPKTEAQETNRLKFARIQKLVQIGMSINKGQGSFITTGTTEFRARQHWAFEKPYTGREFLARIPVWRSETLYVPIMACTRMTIGNPVLNVHVDFGGSPPEQNYYIYLVYMDSETKLPAVSCFNHYLGGSISQLAFDLRNYGVWQKADRDYSVMIGGVNVSSKTSQAQVVPLWFNYLDWS